MIHVHDTLDRSFHISVTTISMNADRVEVLSGVQRRRRYTAEQKMAVVHEAMQPGMTISYVARRHGISPSLILVGGGE